MPLKCEDCQSKVIMTTSILDNPEWPDSLPVCECGKEYKSEGEAKKKFFDKDITKIIPEKQKEIQ